MKNIRIFDKDSVDSLPWPENEHSQFVKHLLLPVVKNGTNHYFNNVNTEFNFLLIDDLVFPFSVNGEISVNSYVCSAYSHYIRYGFSEIKFLKNRILRFVLHSFLKVLEKLFEYLKIDKIVIVNNFLLSTNFYPTLSRSQIQRITNFLIKKYPGHLIAFRSISSLSSQNMEKYLRELNYDLIINRMAYYTEADDDQPEKSRMYKSDLKVLEKSKYQISKEKQVDERIFTRIKELYSALNIVKYSKYNPQYNENFIKLMINHPAFSVRTLEKNGRIDAVLIYFTYAKTACAPIIGYDTKLNQDLGLYRQISMILLKEAGEKGLLLHQSSGCGHFKELRRAKEKFEYLAVFHKHLPFKRKIPWKILEIAMNIVGKKILRAYKL